MPRHLPHTVKLAFLASASAAMLLTMSGCLITSSKGTTFSGAYVEPSSFSQVHLNQTTTTEAEDILGQPTTRTPNDDGTETWTWNWTSTKKDRGMVLFVFSSRNRETVEESTHIKFKDNIAIRKWRD